MSFSETLAPRSIPQPRAMLELIKPITWFPPIWAYLCGAVSAGVPLSGQWPMVILGMVLAGPVVCGMSQAANDWCDRHVDAVNEPHRPIPSGRIPGQWGLYFALLWSLLCVAVGALLGTWVLVATVLGLFLAWAYSAPPLRLKLNGWWGNAAVGLSYEGLAWVTGTAVMLGGAMPGTPVLLLALLYSLGAHGIMTLNDFKSLTGDRQLGVRTIPVQLGPDRAARLACAVMTVPQLVVIGLLWFWGLGVYGAVIALLLVLQWGAMLRLLRDPRGLAPWYNTTGVTLYVLGMMASAVALRSLVGVPL